MAWFFLHSFVTSADVLILSDYCLRDSALMPKNRLIEVYLNTNHLPVCSTSVDSVHFKCIRNHKQKRIYNMTPNTQYTYLSYLNITNLFSSFISLEILSALWSIYQGASNKRIQ